MRLFTLVLLCTLALPTLAAEQAQSLPAPVIRLDALRVTPPLRGILQAAAESKIGIVSTSVTVDFDDLGNVLSVKLNKPTGFKSLDRAIRAWAAKVKIKTDAAGSASIPIVMSAAE